MEYTPQTFRESEAFDYGYSKGIEDALGELHELFGTELEATDLWKEYVNKGEY